MNRLALLVLCSIASGVPYAHADEAAAMAILGEANSRDTCVRKAWPPMRPTPGPRRDQVTED